MIRDFISLVFPTLCAACGDGLYKGEDDVCTKCLFDLPKTNYHLNHDNPVARLLWGRVNVLKAASYYRFAKGGKVSDMIHRFKYKGQKNIGITIGKQFAHELKETDWLNGIDAIVPVPLHKAKLKKRGYNQSEYFAIGISAVSDIPVLNNVLLRTAASETQTRRSRYLRWKNVESIFKVDRIEQISGKSILLVDDVITTGATIEACAQRILEIPDTKVSVATMAYATL